MRVWPIIFLPSTLLASDPCREAILALSPSTVQSIEQMLPRGERMPPLHKMTDEALLPWVRKLETTYERERKFLFWGIAEPRLLRSPLRPLMGRNIRSIEEVLKNEKMANRLSRWHGADRGVSSPLLITLLDGTVGVWKSSRREFVNYRAEVLAYELSERLGLNLVPPTVERDIDGVRGSLQLFVEGLAWGRVSKPQRQRAPKQFFHKQGFFDYLIGNRDRSDDNTLLSSSGLMYSIDHSYTFFDFVSKGEEVLRAKAIEGANAFRQTQEGRAIVEKLGSLDREELYIQARHYIGKRRAEHLMDRIELLLTGEDIKFKF